MRVPPQAVLFEESLLGSLLLGEAQEKAFGELKVDDFYNPEHREIYKAMYELYTNAKPVDVLTVSGKLGEDTVGKISALTESASFNVVETAIEAIKDCAIRRKLIVGVSKSIEECYDTNNSLESILDKISGLTIDINTGTKSYLHEITDTMYSVLDKITQIQENKEPLGIKTGLDIDYILGGFQNGLLYFLGARPSMGKTALVMTFMNEFARKGISSAVLSLETSNESLGFRLLAQKSEIAVNDLKSGRLNDAQLNKIYDSARELSKYGILIDDSPSAKVEQLRGKFQAMVKKGAQIIFVDFLTLIKGEGRSKHEEVGTITKMLKELAKELNIPVVVLAQLSRKVEDRTNKRPHLSDLRESGSIEEDADAILFLYRDEYYSVTTTPDGRPTAGLAEIIIAKNKDGKTGTKELFFDAESMKFKNLETAPF